MAQTSFYSRNYIGWPAIPVAEYSNPNSQYWLDQADMYCTWIDLAIGAEARHEWAQSLPESVVTNKDWALAMQAKFREVNPPTQRKQVHT